MLGKPVAEPVVGALAALPREYLRRGRARRVDADLLADEIGRLLGHQAVRRQLPAHDRDEVRHAVPTFVIEDDVRPGDFPTVRAGGLLGIERPDARVSTQDAQVSEVRKELLALGHELRDLVALDVVDIRIGHADLGRSQDRDGVNRHHDVAVARDVAAVDDRVGHTLVVDQHRSLARRHVEPDAGERGNAPGPCSRGRHHEAGGDAVDRAGPDVGDGHRADEGAVALDLDDLPIRQSPAVAVLGVAQVGFDQLPRLERRVGNAERPSD